MNRIQRIEAYFTDLIMTQLGQAISMPDREMWDDMPLPPEQKFGWMPPLPYEHPGGGPNRPVLLIAVCPEIINEHTAHLDDEAFEAYIGVIGHILTIHVAEYPFPGMEGLSSRERTELAERELFDVNPDLIRLVSEVQMKVLDER